MTPKKVKWKKVTIISTVKNIADTAKPWLDSLLSQNYKGKFDIVIIDSFSDDGTKEILKEYAKKYSKIRIVKYESSQPQALNYAIEKCKPRGEILAFIDGDCVAKKNWLKNLVSALEKRNLDAVGGPALTPKNSNFLQRLIGYDLDFRFLSTPRGLVKRHPNMNLAVRKNVFKKIKFNPKLPVGYDTYFGYALNSLGYKMGFEPSAIVYHYHRASLNKYAKQQFNSGKYSAIIYKQLPKAVAGDNINPKIMIFQPVFFSLFGIFLFVSFFQIYLIYFTLAMFAAISIIFIYSIGQMLARFKKLEVFFLYFLYWYRLFFWTAGLVAAIPMLGGKK